MQEFFETTHTELEERLRFETTLAEISSRFVNIPANLVDSEIEDAQRRICETLGLDISSLWQYSTEVPGSVFLTHLYRPFEGPPLAEQVDARDIFPWSLEQALANRVVAVSTDSLPSEASHDQSSWNVFGIKSTLAFPLSAGGGPIIGVLAFNTIFNKHSWPEPMVKRLQLAAQIFANALARKRSDEMLRESEQSLKRAEEKYRNLFDGALEGIYESSPDGKLITANNALARILGYDSPQELISLVKNLGKEVWYNEHEREEYIQKLARENIVLKYECKFLRRDGTVIWVSLSTQRISNSEGQTICYSGFIEDITERMLIETEARKLRDELAHITRVAALAELTGALAHEFNQPLTAIIANARAAQRFLSQEEADLKEISEILEDIIHDGSRAGDVIRKFRSLLKKEEVRYELLNLNHVIEEILSIISNDMALASVTVLRDLHPALPSIWGDRIQLQQVILNLIFNGVAAMRDTPSARRRIIVRTTMPDERTVEAFVRDCGTGFDEQEVEHLFHPFYTTKPQGLGMGLSISQTIVKAHGGTMEASNNPEGGATFAFFLPVHQATT